MKTSYKPFDGDYTDADYTRLLDDIQTEQGINIGASYEICVNLIKDDKIHVVCSNDDGSEWVFEYSFPIPTSWDIETIRAMFEGNVYMNTDAYQKPENTEDEE
jgi:hypothetical protein